MVNATQLGGRIPLALLTLRLSVFLVMFMWVLDKFVKPEHASQVFGFFYGINGLGNTVVYGIGVVQLLIVLGFVLGARKSITYALVLAMHGLSTIISFRQYFDPFTSPNLLFFAAWPMLAACFTLYYLRDYDRLLTIGK
ncbi:MAG: hypothetical protein AAF215_07960 [Cyanobacteria bacterium P01_A01_bin.123]